MKNITLTTVVIAAALSIVSCSKLSHRAQKMVGNYYIPEISEDEPLMELNADGTCVFRAIKPGVLTYVVKGKWDVVEDSLKAVIDAETLEVDGDSMLIGEIPQVSVRHIVMFNDLNLELEKDGIHYIYHRRNN